MIDVIVQKLIEFFPQISVYFIIVIVVMFVTYKMTVFYINTKKATSKFPKIEDTLNRIDKGFTTLNQILLEKNVISRSCYSEENSPRAINPLGLRLFSESGAEKLFNSIKDELLTKLEKKKFDSLLELERSSLDVIIENMNDYRFKDVQNFAFQHPTFNGNPLTYTDILFVMSLRLRDTYREKHKNSNLDSSYTPPNST